MGTLYLVRHGQASFGSADYDQLSDLGQRQARRLGEWFAHKGIGFDAVFTGTLKRQIDTWSGIAQGLQASGAQPSAVHHAALNEYDATAVLSAIHPQPLPKPDTPETYRQHFRLLRDGLRQWMAGSIQPQGMISYSEFAQGVAATLELVRAKHHGHKVLIVSSGGPISTVIGQVLGTSAETTIELNFRIRNSSVTELAFTPKRHMLVTYNTLPHLDHSDYRDWVTYA